jgi:hypothetical protein
MNPLEYGKLIRKIDNYFIVQINKTNVVDIIQEENRNIVKFYREGDLIYEYKDIKIDDNTFERYLDNKNLHSKIKN